MTFDDYENDAMAHAHYPTVGHAAVYPVLALAGEAGEVANQLKKALRDSTGRPVTLTKDERYKLLLELGDVLWYVTAAAGELGTSLEGVAQLNLDKLEERYGKRVCSNG